MQPYRLACVPREKASLRRGCVSVAAGPPAVGDCLSDGKRACCRRFLMQGQQWLSSDTTPWNPTCFNRGKCLLSPAQRSEHKSAEKPFAVLCTIPISMDFEKPCIQLDRVVEAGLLTEIGQ